MAPQDGDASQVSLQESASYEAAVDILRELIGYAADEIHQEKERPTASQANITSWQRRQTEWTSRLRDLDPNDAAAVRNVLNHDGRALRSLRGTLQ